MLACLVTTNPQVILSSLHPPQKIGKATKNTSFLQPDCKITVFLEAFPIDGRDLHMLMIRTFRDVGMGTLLHVGFIRVALSCVSLFELH